MNAFERQNLRRKAQNAYLREDNPGCLLVLVLMLVSTLIALVR
jgi:hypothetical protein